MKAISMMLSRHSINEEMETIMCPSCGINFGLPATYYHYRSMSGKATHCPNGHSISINQETALDDLYTEMARAQKEEQKWQSAANDKLGDVDQRDRVIFRLKADLKKLRTQKKK